MAQPIRGLLVPIASFLLALLLALLNGSSTGLLHARRVAQEPTGQPCCDVCVKVIILGPAANGPDKGKGGSKYSGLTAADRKDIADRVKVAADL